MTAAHGLRSVRGMPTHACREAAFTLIEVVIVCLITAVVLAMAFAGRDSSGGSAHRAGAVSAARALGDSIQDFRKDHGGRPPVLGSADWPTTTTTTRNRGPRNTYTGRTYMRSRAIEVLDSRIAGVVSGGATAPAPARFTLQYYRVGGRPGGWTIVVRDNRGVIRPCHVTGGSMTPPSGSGTLC